MGPLPSALMVRLGRGVTEIVIERLQTADAESLGFDSDALTYRTRPN